MVASMAPCPPPMAVRGHRACAAAAAAEQPLAPAAPVAIPPVPAFPPVALRHCDYFVYSFDRMSRRTGQGGHKAHSFLALDRLPRIDRLRDALKAAANLFPMMTAVMRRRWGDLDSRVAPIGPGRRAAVMAL